MCLLNINYYYNSLLQRWHSGTQCSYLSIKYFLFHIATNSWSLETAFCWTWDVTGNVLQESSCSNSANLMFTTLICTFYTPFSRRLVSWWNTAAVRTAAVFSQMHCFCGIPTALQRAPRPYCAILGIISVCVPDPRQEEMKYNHPVVCRREEQLRTPGRTGSNCER